MLVITRKNGEQVIIGHNIEVTVLKVQGNRVKLGIHGPADVPILRKELQARTLYSLPDIDYERTLSVGLTAERKEKRTSAILVSHSGHVSKSTATMRRRLAHEGEAADRELKRRIKSFLEGLNLPALSELAVEVRNGAAVITGRVRTNYQKQLATSCCQRVAGVLNVLNEVRVTDSPGMCATCEDGS